MKVIPCKGDEQNKRFIIDTSPSNPREQTLTYEADSKWRGDCYSVSTTKIIMIMPRNKT